MLKFDDDWFDKNLKFDRKQKKFVDYFWMDFSFFNYMAIPQLS